LQNALEAFIEFAGQRRHWFTPVLRLSLRPIGFI
jgi:hypothetical protein